MSDFAAKNPIIYDDLVDIRFSDLDQYNHVNSKHYLDIVSTARLTYFDRVMKMPIHEVTKRGIGFYMTKATVNFKKPIVGLQRVRAKSHVAEILEGKKLIIPFELMTEDGTKLFSDGVLEFTVIDMQTGRSTSSPEWLLELFFK